MVEFEQVNGVRVLVNPSAIQWVESIPGQIGVFNLVMSTFPVADARGGAVMGQHAIQVKNETWSDIKRKLGALPAGPFIAGLSAQAS